MNRISVIVPTYNRPQALDKVLASLAAQKVAPYEIIVADDGSGPATAAVVASWQERIGCPLRHVWQEDEGFRLARSRNQAALAATGDYLVFLDGDCLAFPDFVSRHAASAEPERFVAGSRILIGAKLTQAVESGLTQPLGWGLARWVVARLGGEVNRLLPLIRLPDGGWRVSRPRRWQGARGCNLGIWRRDYVAINGCDEAFNGWGHDDAELVVRLIRNGVLRKEGRFAVPVLHLWHKENDRSNESENRRRLQDVIDGRRPVRADVGMNKENDKALVRTDQ